VADGGAGVARFGGRSAPRQPPLVELLRELL
jgi:hypothetical protein